MRHVCSYLKLYVDVQGAEALLQRQFFSLQEGHHPLQGMRNPPGVQPAFRKVESGHELVPASWYVQESVFHVQRQELGFAVPVVNLAHRLGDVCESRKHYPLRLLAMTVGF